MSTQEKPCDCCGLSPCKHARIHTEKISERHTQEKPPRDGVTVLEMGIAEPEGDGDYIDRLEFKKEGSPDYMVMITEKLYRERAYESLKAELRGSEHRFGSTYAHQLEKENESLRRERDELAAKLKFVQVPNVELKAQLDEARAAVKVANDECNATVKKWLDDTRALKAENERLRKELEGE